MVLPIKNFNHPESFQCLSAWLIMRNGVHQKINGGLQSFSSLTSRKMLHKYAVAAFKVNRNAFENVLIRDKNSLNKILDRRM